MKKICINHNSLRLVCSTLLKMRMVILRILLVWTDSSTWWPLAGNYFPFIPPPHWLGGWACFCVAIGFIGIVTAVVGEFANLFGYVLGIEPTSLPLLLLLLELLCLIPSHQWLPPKLRNMLIPLLEMLQDLTLSMSSSDLVSHGLLLPCGNQETLLIQQEFISYQQHHSVSQ